MAEDYRPHLLITEDDVKPFENKRQARTKDFGMDPAQHGSKLSGDLQAIVDAYTKAQGVDSLSGEGVRLFEIVLREGEKISNKTLRDFLEQEGMVITSVRDSRHATVMQQNPSFSDFQRRVGNYRSGQAPTKKFNSYAQYIEGFQFPESEPKKAPSLQELIDKAEEFPIDVEITEELLPKGTDPQLQSRAEQRLLSQIKQRKGTVISSPYKLSDGTPVIRAEVPLGEVDNISKDSMVSRITKTSFYSTSPAYVMQAQRPMVLDPNVPLDDLPIVVVLDDGVGFPSSLEPLVVEHWTPTGAKPGNKVHGTGVASKIAFSNVGEQLGADTMIPRARIIDCNIRGEDPKARRSDRPDLICNETLIARVREAVLRYKDIAQIFNFSSNEEDPIPGDEISILGYEFDVLSIQYGVKFTISAGNHYLYRSQDSLEAILQDDEIRIASPSDSMLNISVGAIVGAEHKEGLSRQFDIAPYSRIGPGFRGFRKPDIVSYSGTMTKTDFVPPDDFSMVIGKGGTWGWEAGTSYAAPTVAGDLAEISRAVPDHDILQAEALLYHGAKMPIAEEEKRKITRDENAFYGNVYGRGIARPIDSMFSTPHKVTFLHRGTMNKKYKQHVSFFMPSICDEKFNMRTTNNKIRIVVTCVTQPPIDRTKGADYLGAYIFASLHPRNRNNKLFTHNPTEADSRKEWDTCFHFPMEFSSFHGGDWEIWLELHTRYDVDDEQNVDYAIAITIEDLTQSLNLYDAVVNEAQNRFPAVQMVRLPIRF